jgi:hypothetical protein
MVRCTNRFTRSTREEGEPSSPMVEVATGVGVRWTTSSTLPPGGLRGGESRDGVRRTPSSTPSSSATVTKSVRRSVRPLLPSHVALPSGSLGGADVAPKARG